MSAENGIRTLTNEGMERPGALELGRILEALKAKQTPDPADVDAVRALNPTAAAGNGYDLDAVHRRLPAIMEELHGADPKRQAAAWDQIAPLLTGDPTDQLKDGVERITDWGAIEAPDREFLIDQWLPRGRIGMFSGRGGSGKTLLLIQLAATMAAGGGLWLGRAGANDPRMPVAAAGVAVFASWEDEGAEFKRRLGWIDAAERKTYHRDDSLFSRIGDRFRFLDLSRRGPVWGVEKSGLYNQRASLLAAGEIVRAECEQTGASLLILDSLGYAYGRNDNDNEGVADFMADWDSWGRDHGCTVALVHHPPKEQGGKNAGSGYRGASSWEMHSRWRWELGNQAMAKGTLDRLTCEKASYNRRPDPVWLDRDQKTGWVWREQDDQNPRPKEKNGAGQDNKTKEGPGTKELGG